MMRSGSITRVGILLLLVVGSDLRGAAGQTLRLRPVLTIGGDLAEAPYTFTRIGSIESTAAGEIFVLDTQERQVKVFDTDGRFVRTIGRPGGGPGEFGSPARMQLDSLVRVFDAVQQRADLFALDGRFVETQTFRSVPGTRVTGSHPLRHAGVLLVSGAVFSLGGPTHQPNEIVTYVAPAAARVDTLLQYHSGGTLWHPVDRQLPWGIAPSEFGAGGAFAVLDDSVVAVADGYSGEVRWYRADRDRITEVRRARVGTASAAVTRVDLDAVERRLRSGGGGASTVGPLALVGPPRWSVASRAVFADNGSLWVRNSSANDRGHAWTVFPPGEGAARTTRLPSGFELRSIRGDRMFGVTRTEFDVEVVRVYEWRWE